VDVVLVEGFKQLEGLRRVVFRGTGEPRARFRHRRRRGSRHCLEDYRGKKLPLDDTEAVLDFILSG
jgi:molybdopterin-guanine dinucleotide biosynthesis protein